MHFVRGAKQSSAASMFNLGLCYELGIGTLADQKKVRSYTPSCENQLLYLETRDAPMYIESVQGISDDNIATDRM